MQNFESDFGVNEYNNTLRLADKAKEGTPRECGKE